jgi:hypothetical protein
MLLFSRTTGNRNPFILGETPSAPPTVSDVAASPIREGEDDMMAFVEAFAALLLPLTTLSMVIAIILLIYKSLTGQHTIFEPLSKTEAASPDYS